MRGDRVKIITGTLYEDRSDALVFVYGAKLDQQGNLMKAYDNTILIESLGGVKNGSTGVIMGPPEKVHRAQLRDQDGVPGLASNDFVEVVPVMLDYYQQLGWFPTVNVRIV